MSQNDNDDLGLGDLELPSLPSGFSTSPQPVKTTSSEDTEDDGEEDNSETGVHENPVDEVLNATATPGADIPPLTAAEELTLQVKTQFEAACKRGEELLNDTELTLGDRCKSIESISIEIDMLLDKEAIKSDEDLLRKGRDLRSELRLALEHTLLRLCLEPSGATPSTLPEKIEGVADHELERMAHGLNELSLKAVTAKGKESAEKLLDLIEGDKARRAATPRVSVPPPSGERVTGHEPTQAVSLTPVPEAPKAEESPEIIPPPAALPESLGTAWQSGPEAAKASDPKEVVTQDAPVELKPAPAAPPPASTPANQENPVNHSMPGQARTQMRIGRAADNDWVIDNPTVSMHHAVLTLNSGSIKVEDLGSSNGTFYANELGGWNRVPKEHPATVPVGRAIKFGSVIVFSTRDAEKQTHLHFVVDLKSGKLSESQAFFLSGEELSKLNALEQARIDEEEAKRPRVTPPEDIEARKAPVTTGEIRRQASRAPIAAMLMAGVGLMAAVAFLVAGGLWVADRLGVTETVASTETETSSEDATASEVETVTTPVVAEAETETSTPESATETIDETSSSYACRPGRERTGCGSVERFLLGRGNGDGYWDCSSLSNEDYRGTFRAADPSGATPGVIANFCSCQWCEPEEGT